MKLAEGYPGKYRKDNPTGSLLTKKQHIEKQVQNWIDHFGDSQDYQNENLANKVRYLERHMKPLNVTRKAARKLLVQLESKHAERGIQTVPERQLENNNVDEEMEFDNEGENPVVENVDNVEMIDSEHNSDEDMFAEDDIDREFTRNASDLELATVLAKSDVELFEEGLEVSPHVERSKKYIEMRRHFIDKYVDVMTCLKV